MPLAPRPSSLCARSFGLVAGVPAVALWALSGTAWAAPPDDGASGASGSADAGGTASIGGSGKRGKRKADANAEGPKRRPREDAPPKSDRWIHRHAPVRNMGELGVFGGAWFPNPNIELFEVDPSLPGQGRRTLAGVSPILGIRGAYLPIRHLALEGEFAWSPSQTRQDALSVDMLSPRFHVVGQIGLWSVTPFLLAGIGSQSVLSRRAAVGSETDLSLTFGGGVKFHLNDALQLRLDGRIDLSNRAGVGEGVVASPEILLGLAGTFRKRKGGGAMTCGGDRDGDHLPDSCDACPDEPGPAPSGCPISDRDRDGIADDIDHCPEQPETKNGYDDDDGCPDIVPPELVDLAGIIKGVVFDVDKDTIKGESKAILDRAAELLNQYPSVRLEIVGHTDSRGSYAHNVDLSRRRAQSVKRYLVAKGIAPSRLTTRGAGPGEPIADNETEAGRQTNRRIEFRVVSGEGIRSSGGVNDTE